MKRLLSPSQVVRSLSHRLWRLSRSLRNQLPFALHCSLGRLDQLAREGQRSQKEVHVELHRGWYEPLGLLSPLLSHGSYALHLLREQLHPAEEDTVDELQIAILEEQQIIHHRLVGLMKGYDNHIQK